MLLSVIIPSKNRADQVRTCVKALTWQTVSRDKFEIVVVDDGSTDNTLELLNDFKKQYPDLNLRVVSTNRHEEKFKAGVARNFGANHANGKILLFIDSDIIAEPHMLENHLNYFNKYKNVTVMGYRFGILFPFQYIAKDLVEKGQIERMAEFPLTYDCREPQKIEDRLPNGFVKEEDIPWRHYHSHNIAVPKDDYWAAGGFDENFSGWGDEDLELGYRLWKRGLKFVFDREIIGFHLDHFAHKKQQLVSEYQNKRRTLLKHQDLEIDLYNDDTNPLFWTRKEKPYFEDLRKKPYKPLEEGLEEVTIPLELTGQVECVIGEGVQLSAFKQLKYLVNIRQATPPDTPAGTEHIKIIGSLLPFKAKQFKKIVIYNYLDLFLDFYKHKIIAEALRVADEVYIFHSRLNDQYLMISSFASKEVSCEIDIDSILVTKGYAKLRHLPSLNPDRIPVNILLNSYEEISDNANLIRIAVWLDKLGYKVNLFSGQFNFRHAFEKGSHLFRTYAGFFYRKIWDYLDSEDQRSVNIHSQVNPRWNHQLHGDARCGRRIRRQARSSDADRR
jgi:glycosyltransferase involved in cell wall biosynthesis